MGRDLFNYNSNRSDREKWSTSIGGPVFLKLFRLDRTDKLSFESKFAEIFVEWIAPMVFTREKNDTSNQNRERSFFTCEKNDTSNQTATEVCEFRAKIPAFYCSLERLFAHIQ